MASLLGLAAMGLTAGPTHAATLTWGTGGAGGAGTWNTASGWWDGTTQQTWSNATPDDAIFGGTGGAVALSGPITAGGITFDPFTGSYTIGTASQALTINGGGITMNSGAGTVEFQNSPITLGAAQNWTNNSSSLLTVSSGISNGGNLLTVAGSGSTTLSGAIAGTGGLTKSGAGTLTLSASNTYSGTTTVNGGLITTPSNTTNGSVGVASFGTGPIEIGESGTLQMTGWNGTALSTIPAYYASGYTNTVSGSGTLEIVGQSDRFSVNYSGDLTNFSGTVSMTAADGFFVGFGGGSTTSPVNLSGSNARFVINGTGQFLPAFGGISRSGTLAIGELSGDGDISSGFQNNTTYVIGGRSTSSTFSGRFTQNSGTTSVTKVGSGTLTLTGSNAYTGTTTIEAGRLALEGDGVLNAGNYAGAIANAGELVMGSDVNQILSGVISGAGSLVKSGTGTLSLAGTNSYVGGTTVNAGILGFASQGSIPGWGTPGAMTVAAAGALAVGNDTSLDDPVIAGYLDPASGLGFDTSAGDRTWAAAITGTRPFVKAGANTLTLTGSNAYTGGTLIGAGVLALGNADALGTSGTIWFGGGTLQFSASNATDYSSRFSTAANQAYRLDTNGQNVQFVTALASSGGSLTKLGSGTLTLTGSNAYTGTTTIEAGRLALEGNGVLNAGSYAGAIANAGELVMGSDVDQILSGVISGTGSLLKSGAGTLTLSAGNNYSGGTTVSAGTLVGSNLSSFGSGTIAIEPLGSVRVTALATSYFVNGVTNAVSGSGELQLVGSSAATSLNYSGDLSAFAGTVSVTSTAGTFVAVGDAATAGFSSGSNAVFDVSGAGTFYPLTTGNSSGEFAMGELRGNGVIQNRVTSHSLLRIGDLGTPSAFSGILRNNPGDTPGGGSLALVKVGAGTLTLSGSNSYSGGTTVSNGVVVGSHRSSFGTGPIAIGASGTVRLTGWNGGVNQGPDFTVFYGSGYTNAVSGSGVLVVVGQSANYSVNYSGDLSNFSGTVSMTAASGFYVGFGGGSTTSPVNLSGANARFEINGAGLFLPIFGGVARTGTIAMGELSGNGNISSGFENSTTYVIGGLSTSSSFSGTLAPASGTLSITKVGSGTLTLTGSNSFNGSTQLDGGVLALGSGNALGTSGTISFGGGTLQFSASNATDYSSRFSTAAGQAYSLDTNGENVTVGTALSSSGGSLTKSGQGTLTLSAANTYAGHTTIAGGTLKLGSGGGLASAAIDVAFGAEFDVSALTGGYTVASGQQLRGAGTILGSLLFGADSKLAFTSSLSVDSGTVSFAGFGIDDIVGLDGTLVSAGTYTLLGGTATFDLTGALNVGFDERVEIGGGKEAYFNQGSLQVIVVPEPGAFPLAGCGVALAGWLAARRRRRR